MEGVAVTRIKDRNFQVLSCYSIADCILDKVIFNKDTLNKLLNPLNYEVNDSDFIKKIEKQAKKFLLKNFEEAPQIILWNFKNPEGKEYGIAFQKVGVVVFAFLLTPISSADLKELERHSERISYLTGDEADLSLTKKDFIQ